MYPPGASAAMVLFLVGVVTFFFLVFLPFVLASLLRSVAARALLAPLSVFFLFFFFFSFFLIFLSSIRPLESAGKHLMRRKEGNSEISLQEKLKFERNENSFFQKEKQRERRKTEREREREREKSGGTGEGSALVGDGWRLRACGGLACSDRRKALRKGKGVGIGIGSEAVVNALPLRLFGS